MHKQRMLVLIKGAGEMASGIAHRLSVCDFSVVMTEIPFPTVIRRGVSFAQAIFSGETTIEGVTAVLSKPEQVLSVLEQKRIPVVVDPEAKIARQIKPNVLVDAILAKRNMGTTIGDAKLVIGIGPGFEVGKDVHYCIETMRGHYLGKVLTQGQALPDTGIPGEIAGFTKERVVRAPKAGIFHGSKKIGDHVEKDDVVGHIAAEIILSPLSGVLRGLIQEGCSCQEGMKIGDVDPRDVAEYCWQISEKARSISGGVLEAILRKFSPGGKFPLCDG